MLQFIYLVMLAVVGVSARSIGHLGQLQPSTNDIPISRPFTPPPKNRLCPPDSLNTCSFQLQSTNQHQKALPTLDGTQRPLLSHSHSESAIPRIAWPHIGSLLAAYLINPPPSMQTLNLGHLLNDAELEAVVLGIVYSTGTKGAGRAELRMRDRDGDGNAVTERLECVKKAVEEVERKRLTEGVIEFKRGGRVSFLVYRVD